MPAIATLATSEKFQRLADCFAANADEDEEEDADADADADGDADSEVDSEMDSDAETDTNPRLAATMCAWASAAWRTRSLGCRACSALA